MAPSFSSELNLASTFEKEIQPFWQQHITTGQFITPDHIPIAYAYVTHAQAIGSIVISSGRIESLLKYKELIFDLYQQGYSVFIHDHRGQGLSGRLLPNSQLGYVRDFSDYVDDFSLFIQQVVTPNSHHKPKLLCHSMGGAIGALMVLKQPDLFDKVVFSAPMFGIRPALPDVLARILLDCHALLRSKEMYFWGQKDYVNQVFKGNDLTHSKARYQLFRDEYLLTPTIQLGGVTGQWLRAAIIAMNNINRQAKAFPIPALVLQAAEDTVVDNNRQALVATNMTNTEFIVVDGAKHELLMESDAIRNQCLTGILHFLSNK